MNSATIRTVGIVSPGDMGHAVARELISGGKDVVACLSERSTRTRNLAVRSGIRDVSTLETLVSEADLLLSILVPSAAAKSAEEIAAAIARSGTSLHYVDCNAISPQTVSDIGESLQAVNCRFTDGGIVGSPPSVRARPRLFVSGPHATELNQLDGMGFEIKVLGETIGQASGFKMCYAAMTKGTSALQYALTIAAQRMGLLNELLSEFSSSQAAAYGHMQRALPKLPAKSGRWVGEMEEIASTFAALGLPAGFHQAAAELYQMVSNTSLGRETPETIDANRDFTETIRTIVHESFKE